jgi:heme-degrading monooxygenase HmoA
MVLIRDVFRCKPGKAKELAERFLKTIPLMQAADGFLGCRVLVDLVADYWTVVLESEAEDLSGFERHVSEFTNRSAVREIMAGYMELVEGGHREIFRIV